MTKVLQRKPGPKSSKQSRIISKRGTLGETTGESNSDDSSAEQTTFDRETTTRTPEQSGSKSLQQKNPNVSEFCTPDADKDNTDYGLEFTTSHIQNLSPRRCSTLRTADEGSQEIERRAAAEDLYNSTKENNTPTSSLSHNNPPAKSKPVKKAPQKKPTKSQPKEKTKDTPTAQDSVVATQQAAVKKPRKQKNPLELEKRFQKEVRMLQNRTDNLLPLLPFSRIVREIMYDSSRDVTRITATALQALQTSAELYITQRLQDAYLLTLHRGRVTLDVKDMDLVKHLKMVF